MKKLIGVSALVIALVWFVTKDENVQKDAQTIAQTVRVAQVASASGAQDYRVSGTVRSVDESALAAQVTGTLMMRVAAGDAVAKGQVIATIAAPEFGARSAQARTALASAEAAERQARRHWNDLKPEAREQTKLATASARAELRAVDAQTAKTVVRAPFAGTVLSAPYDTGATVAPGAVVARIGNTTAREVIVMVAQDVARDVRSGDTVQIDTAQDMENAQIERVAPTADVASQKTAITVVLASDTQFALGQFVTVVFDTPIADSAGGALQVPVGAVRLAYDDAFVFVITDNGVVQQKRVTVGAIGGDAVVVAGDIVPGDVVAVTQVHELVDGETVAVQY